MFGTQHLLTFILSGLVLNVAPGQDTFYILSRSVAHGRRAGLLSVLGICSGAAFHNLIAAFGLAAVLQVSPVAFAVLKYAGAAYLAYLGIRTLLSKSGIFEAQDSMTDHLSHFKLWRDGFLTDLFNPKVALFFLAFLPQFVNPLHNYGAFSFLFLGFIFIFNGGLWCSFLALFASKVSGFLRKDPKTARVLNTLCGVVFIALAVDIAVTAG